MINGIGGKPPAIGAKIISGIFPSRKLSAADRSDSQQRHYRYLMSEVNYYHGVPDPVKLYRIQTIEKLTALIKKEIMEFFSPDHLSFVKKEQETPFTAPRDAALSNIQLIYIPGRTAGRMFVSGQPGRDRLLDVLEITPQQLDIDPQSLPDEYESAVIVPLVSGLGEKRPLEEYPRHGAIILAKSRPNGFDPLVDLPILTMISENMTAAMVRNHLAL